MSATLAPQGLVPARHLSGTIRVENQVDGVLSGYATSLFTGSPVARGTNGTLEFTTGVAGPCIGVFQGCEFSAATKRFVLPYFPAGQTYDAGTMIAKYSFGAELIYEGQSVGPVPATAVGEAVNISGATTSGSTFTGFSTQALGAPTGVTAGSFIIHGLAPYDDNAWGDAFTRILVRIATPQGAVALAANAPGFEEAQKRAEDEARQQEIWKARREEDEQRRLARKEEDDQRLKDRKDEDAKREEERKAVPPDASTMPADPPVGSTYAPAPPPLQY